MRPSPRQFQTWHQSLHGPQVRVVPALVTVEAATRGWRSSPPSPQARRPASPHGVQGGDPMGMGIHLLTSDAEQHMGVVPPMLGLTKLAVCSSYAVRRVRCYMTVLALLCWRLNRYCTYLANEVIRMWK
jgi:hypothetical protein